MNFISFSCLIALVMASRTVLKTCSENQHLCLVCDFRRKVFSIKCDNGCKDSYFLQINFVICNLREISLTAAGALGPDWQKKAGGLTSQYVRDAAFPTSSCCPLTPSVQYQTWCLTPVGLEECQCPGFPGMRSGSQSSLSPC